MRWSVALLLALATTVAQDLPKGVIAGTVVDEVSGAAIGLASVELKWQCTAKPPELSAVKTDADGRFRLAGLEPSCYSLIARKSGYLDPFGTRAVAQIELATGQQKTGLTIKLMPEGVISGRLMTETGDPVQNAEVTVLQRTKIDGKLRWGVAGSARSNYRGEYRIGELAAGGYALRATARDDWRRPEDVKQAYAPTYYPNRLVLDTAEPVIVRKGGETSGIDMRVRTLPVFRVGLRMEGLTAGEWLVATVSLERRDGTGVGQLENYAFRRSEPGVVEVFGVPPGSWYVMAHAAPTNDVNLIGTTSIDVKDSDLADVVIQMARPRQLTGQAVIESTGPVRVDWRNGIVVLDRLDGPSSQHYPPRGAVAADGTFSVPYGFPTKYRIAFHVPSTPAAYPASVLIGGEEYCGRDIDLTQGPPGTVKVILRTDTAKISGKLEGAVGGEPGQLGMAVLVPVEAHLRRFSHLEVSQIRANGLFAFGPMPPGDYLLCHAWGDERMLYENGGPPKESMDAAVRLKVEPNGTHMVTLKAVRAFKD